MAFSTRAISSLYLGLQQLLPGQEICAIEQVQEGFSCEKYFVETSEGKYFLRIQNNQNRDFDLELRVTQLVSDLQIGPKLVASDPERKRMLLERIYCQNWPSFEENPEPYQEAMHLLRMFHSRMPAERVDRYLPFSDWIANAKKMQEDMPSQFTKAIENAELISQCLTPWLKSNATYCHGDFHKENALYDGKRVFIIDWETVAWGDPFFDVVKFSLSLKREERLQLFAEYLGHEPSAQEIAHFDLIDLSFLLVVAINRMQLAYSGKESAPGLLSQSEMEELLEAPLPSYASIPFGDSSPESRQRGALYALSEFLQKTGEHSSFRTLLDEAK